MKQRRPKSRGYIIRTTILGVTLSALTGIFGYSSFILEPAAKNYDKLLPSVVNRLNAKCKAIATQSDTLLLSKSSSHINEKITNLNTLRAASTQLESELDTYQQSINSLTIHRYGFVSSSYRKSLLLQEEGSVSIDQIRDILREYKQLLTFLNTYYIVGQHVNDQLDQFNAVVDFNVYGGRASELFKIANNLDAQIDTLAKLTPPRAFGGTATKSITLYRRIADEFRELATGVSLPADSPIYTAASNLEAYTIEYDQLSNSELDTVLEHLPILKSINDLPEITDRFKF